MKSNWLKGSFFISYLLFICISSVMNFKPGIAIGINFMDFCLYMLKILPCAFILIGLFEVWVSKKTIEKHLGKDSGIKAHFWAIALSSFTIGGLYVALPVAYTLAEKGADPEIIFSYLGASGVARIPMTLFEALFIGLGFAIWRRLFSIPLIIISSVLLGKYLKKSKHSFIVSKM